MKVVVYINKAIVRTFTHGFLKDGRPFQITGFTKFCICEDGSIHSGSVELNIDGHIEQYTMSELAENINYSSLPSDIRV